MKTVDITIKANGGYLSHTYKDVEAVVILPGKALNIDLESDEMCLQIQWNIEGWKSRETATYLLKEIEVLRIY